eukprot:TRINITY_DN27556_c0_g1_i1.p1 TRINITY_DN27556_c0_g1~~TRINITY_DN27556_c0_g1_i1.p1  ORF type:complete len:1273 (-),score=300.19 TRINITY_DN27556_c0_g1_i1:90-3908(-)
MGDGAALASQITEALQVLHEPHADAAQRRAANEFVMRVREHPAVVAAAAQLAGATVPAPARFFAFGLLASAAEESRLPGQDPQVVELRASLLGMVTRSALAAGGDLSAVPGFVREKYAQALAAVAIYSANWPAGWPEMQSQLLEAGRQSRVHAALVLSFFRSACEVVQSDAASRLGPQRRKVLQAYLKESCAEIFRCLALFVVSLFPGCPELDRAAVMLVQELAGAVPVVGFLAADVDRYLQQKLADATLRCDVIQAFSELLTKDVSKDIKEAPERMLQFICVVLDLAGSCTASESISAEDYETHRAVAMLIRDFVDCNRGSIEKRPELQARLFQAAMQLLRYPSTVVQLEAISVLPVVLRAALPDARKGAGAGATPAGNAGGMQAKAPSAPPPAAKAVVAQPPSPPAWLQVRGELMPLLFLCAFRQVPHGFDLLPLPPGFSKAMEATSELDADEDLVGMRHTIRAKIAEVILAMTPSPGAMLQGVEFLHELHPRAMAVAGTPAGFASVEAALLLMERLMQNIKACSGPQSIQACVTVLTAVLRAPLPASPEFEERRLEFLGRSSGVLDLLEASAPDAAKDAAVLVFTHLFSVVEAGTSSSELRRKALTACVAACKAASVAIRPVLQALVEKASALLQCVSEDQHLLCEALVVASGSAQNFEQQQNLVQNLLAPLVTRWGPLTQALASGAERSQASLLGDRSELEAAKQLVLCFFSCFRSSTVPTAPAAQASGGFLVDKAAGDASGLRLRNPTGTVATAVLPGLLALLRAFHAAFPAAPSRPSGACAPGAAVGVPPALGSYLAALDREELKALTSSLDSKRQEEADTWDNAFPPAAGEDVARVLSGRSLVQQLRSNLYKCLGATLAVQDGTLTNLELIVAASTEVIQGAHPYHLELQMRDIWMVLFAPSGLSNLTDPMRLAVVRGVLTRVLPALLQALNGSWDRLRLPDAGAAAAAGATSNSTLLWAECTGMVMASRTFVELTCSLVTHGGTPSSLPGAAGAPGNGAGAGAVAGEVAGGKRKGKKAGNNGTGGDMDATGGAVTKAVQGGAASSGFAGVVFTSQEVLEAVQGALLAAMRWSDPKALNQALSGLQGVAVRIMSGGEVFQQLRECHAASPEAPQRCLTALHAVLRPLVNLCLNPPGAPPNDGALHTVIGKPFCDFFLPEKQQGRVQPSPFALGVTAALWPIIWGMCQVFSHVCKRAGTKVEVQFVVHFPALAEACQLLTTLRRVTQQDVQGLLATMLDSGSDSKMQRSALRTLVRRAVDPDRRTP